MALWEGLRMTTREQVLMGEIGILLCKEQAYDELVAALAWLTSHGSVHEHPNGAYRGVTRSGMLAHEIVATARKLGWPGLEEP